METIWNFKDNEVVETEKIDMKTFKATGRFFDDIISLAKLFSIKIHPALRESSYRESKDDGEPDEVMAREITALNFNKYRLDRNSLRVMFLCLPLAQNIQTLK